MPAAAAAAQLQVCVIACIPTHGVLDVCLQLLMHCTVALLVAAGPGCFAGGGWARLRRHTWKILVSRSSAGFDRKRKLMLTICRSAGHKKHSTPKHSTPEQPAVRSPHIGLANTITAVSNR
jgi:hypothetical protein